MSNVLVLFCVREFGCIVRGMRRWYYLTFRKSFVDEQLKKRKGLCGRHGCCDLSLVQRILNKHLKRCLSEYARVDCARWHRLPEACRVYPFDEKDKIPGTKKQCCFYWDETV